MGIFSGIKDAKATIGGIYFLEGQYVVRIKAIKAGKTRKGIACFIVETVVLKSSNKDRPAGMDVSWVITADKDAFLGNVKQFAAEIGDVDEKAVSEEDVEAMCSTENPMAGGVISLSAADIKTKAGGDFTRVIWKRVPIEEQAKYDEAAAA